MAVKDRVKELRRVKASEILSNPKNWRGHSEAQSGAMAGMLEEVGFASALICYEPEDGVLQLIDGHLRRDISEDELVPVLVLDVTEDEADKLLATFDPIGAMAELDRQKLAELLDGIEGGDWVPQADDLAQLLADMGEQAGVFAVDEVDMPELADGDKPDFVQITFHLHNDQAETVKAAMAKAKEAGPFDESLNTNSNGNAIARIAESYL